MKQKVCKKPFWATVSLVAILCSSVFGASSATAEGMTDVQKFYYDLGRKSAKQEYTKYGYRMALQDFKAKVAKYKHEIKAMEAGKYLIEEGKITYPKIYKIRENGSYKIKINAPKVENTFSAEDLFLLPLYSKYENMAGKISEPPAANSPYQKPIAKISKPVSTPPSTALASRSVPTNPNAFDLPDLNTLVKGAPAKRPKKASVAQNSKSVYIPYKSSTVESFLSSFGSKYSETSSGYKVFFSNNREKEKFCKEISGDKTCGNLKR